MASPAEFKLENLSVSANRQPSRFLGSRFTADGVFLPDPGNTVVMHVVPGSATEAAMIELRERLHALPWGHRFAFTDIESLHMTLFQGVLENRRLPDYWPAALPLDAPLEETTDYFLQRLAGFQGPGPFRMRIAEVTPLGLTLTGATEEDERVARAWRDALTAPFGYRAPDHDTYVFHVTFAYIIDWLPDGMIADYRSALAEMAEEFSRRLPVLELGPPALCTFEDMNGFPPVMTIPGTGFEAGATAGRAANEVI